MNPGSPNLRVLFTCGREPAYPRNQTILHALETAFSTRALTSAGRSYPLRLASLYPRTLAIPFHAIDAAWVGFLGQPLVPAIRAMTRAPLLFDAFISLYDTLCFDRKRFSPASLGGRLAYALDSWSCRLASTVLIDTQAHARYFCETFHLDPAKVKVLYAGCDERIFSPLPVQEEPGLVLYYGSFLPLHGIETIIHAANLLRAEHGIRFRILGEGIQSAGVRRLAESLRLENVEFSPSVPLESLPGEIARASLCLGGHFSAIPKAARVIAAKTFQCLAMGKATVVGDNPANAELLAHGENAWFCPMNDPQTLAESIRLLLGDHALRAHLGQAGRQVFLEKASQSVLSRQIAVMTLEATRT